MSGFADLRHLAEEIDDANVGDVCLCLLLLEELCRCVDLLASLGLPLVPFCDGAVAFLIDCWTWGRGAAALC